jgi:hypothetical protein
LLEFEKNSRKILLSYQNIFEKVTWKDFLTDNDIGEIKIKYIELADEIIDKSSWNEHIEKSVKKLIKDIDLINNHNYITA